MIFLIFGRNNPLLTRTSWFRQLCGQATTTRPKYSYNQEFRSIASGRLKPINALFWCGIIKKFL